MKKYEVKIWLNFNSKYNCEFKTDLEKCTSEDVLRKLDNVADKNGVNKIIRSNVH